MELRLLTIIGLSLAILAGCGENGSEDSTTLESVPEVVISTESGNLEAAGPEGVVAETSDRPPNIVLILVDDLGINDLSLNAALGPEGNAAPVATPNIDRIALEGVQFEHAYTAHATCAPSRAGLLTGRRPQRFGFEFNPGSAAFARQLAGTVYDGIPGLYFEDREEGQDPIDKVGLPPEEVTLAELLKSAGYRTAMFGKWHVGMAPAMQPDGQGFDEWVGFLGGASLFAPVDDPGIVNATLPLDEDLWALFRYEALRNGQPIDTAKYQTDLWADEAIEFIKRNADNPFFAYVAFNAPHNPLQAPKAIYDELAHIEDHEQRVYSAMMVSLDRAVGRILDTLDAENLANNTVVIFTSDNGGAEYTRLYNHNLPFRGFKGSFWEGGMRTPLFVRWPAGIDAGQNASTPVHHLDLFPSLAAISQSAVSPAGMLDGRDILTPLMQGNVPVGGSPMIWRAGDVFAIFDGRYKLMTANRPERIWLYDLQEDPTEQVNLAETEPEIVARLQVRLEAFDTKVGPPKNMTLFEIPSRADPPAEDPATEDIENLDFLYWPS